MSSIGGIKGIRNPWEFISILIGIIILTQVILTTYPTIHSNIVNMSTLGNFTFSSLFASDGMVTIVLSAIVLISLLTYLGVKMGSRGR